MHQVDQAMCTSSDDELGRMTCLVVWYNLKLGLHMTGTWGEKATVRELIQLHIMDVWMPMEANKLSWEQGMNAQETSKEGLALTEHRNAPIFWRRMQHHPQYGQSQHLSKLQLRQRRWGRSGYGRMADPYPHPKHMKDMNHHSYAWSGCGNHSMWVWSLNCCMMPWFGGHQWIRIWANNFPNLGQQVGC